MGYRREAPNEIWRALAGSVARRAHADARYRDRLSAWHGKSNLTRPRSSTGTCGRTLTLTSTSGMARSEHGSGCGRRQRTKSVRMSPASGDRFAADGVGYKISDDLVSTDRLPRVFARTINHRRWADAEENVLGQGVGGQTPDLQPARDAHKALTRQECQAAARAFARTRCPGARATTTAALRPGVQGDGNPPRYLARGAAGRQPRGPQNTRSRGAR